MTTIEHSIFQINYSQFKDHQVRNRTGILIWALMLCNYCQKQPPEMFCKKGVLKKLRKFHRKTTVLESLLIKLQAWMPTTLLKRNYRCFSVKFTKFLRTPILKNICIRLLTLVILTIWFSTCKNGMGFRYVFRTLSTIKDGVFWQNSK